jgi:hypothetical protein
MQDVSGLKFPDPLGGGTQVPGQDFGVVLTQGGQVLHGRGLHRTRPAPGRCAHAPCRASARARWPSLPRPTESVRRGCDSAPGFAMPARGRADCSHCSIASDSAAPLATRRSLSAKRGWGRAVTRRCHFLPCSRNSASILCSRSNASSRASTSPASNSLCCRGARFRRTARFIAVPGQLSPADPGLHKPGKWRRRPTVLVELRCDRHSAPVRC